MKKGVIMEFREIVEQSQIFVISSHIGPDGDNVASSIGLKIALENLGKEAYYVMDDDLPKNLSFLYKGYGKKTSSEIKEILRGREYVFVGVDCGVISRLQLEEDIIRNAKYKIDIDHHEGNEMYGDYNAVDINISSTCQLMYQILKEHFPTSLNEENATCFYTGILTDSGNFMYDCADAQTLRIGAELLDLGAKKEEIVNCIFRSESVNYLHLLGQVLHTLKVEGNLAIAYLTRKMREECHISYNDIENLVNYVINIDGVDMGILVKEKEVGEIKLSLRSKGDVDVAVFARRYSGGGHKNAAGCTIEKSLEEVLKGIFIEAKEYLK